MDRAEAEQHLAGKAETEPDTREKIYSIYDDKMQAYMAPFTAPNDAVAIRHFKTTAVGQPGMIAMNPEDYTLWRVGHWTASCALVEAAETISCIARAHELAAILRAEREGN